MKMKNSGSMGMKLVESNLPYIGMVICNLVFTGMALLSKAVISKGMNPYVFSAYRQCFATLVLAPFAFYLERKNAAPLSCSILCKIFMVSLIGITLCINLWNISLSYIPATFASASSNAIPAITFIMAIILRMESMSITEWSGVAKVLGTMLCVCGALVYSFVKGPTVYPQAHQDQNSESYTGCGTKAQCLKGSLLVLSAQATWSLWHIMQGPITKLYPDKLRLTTIQCFFSCIQSAIWAVAVERNISAWKLGWDLNFLAVAYCGVIFVALTYWLRIWVIEKRGPVFAAAFNPLAFIVTAIFSAFLWKETPHWGSVCGALLLVGGLYGVLWGKHKEEKAKPVLELNSETKQENV